uniref:Scaffold protein Nfu/NifU N-terminal domain-containing protein n=1 Tax=Mycena chlorophos TaxID=658473 RepID=A0ABQ0L4H5_MYCCL|nr:predicted protein [Mycena chlorophos]
MSLLRVAARAASAHSRTFSSSALRAAAIKGPTLATASSVWPARPQVASTSKAPFLRRTMFIQTEATPNDDSVKFIPGVDVMGQGTAEFLDTRSALTSPLAIRLMGVEGGGDALVKVKLKGSCRGCDSSTVTLKSGIERMLMHYIPEVKGVEQVLDQEEEIALNEFNKLEQRLNTKNPMAEYMSV